MPACGVVRYEIAELCRLIAESSNDRADDVQRSVHATFFESYFDELGAKTIFVEDQYTDRDYLEDYAAYYSRCFHEFLELTRFGGQRKSGVISQEVHRHGNPKTIPRRVQA